MSILCLLFIFFPKRILSSLSIFPTAIKQESSDSSPDETAKRATPADVFSSLVETSSATQSTPGPYNEQSSSPSITGSTKPAYHVLQECATRENEFAFRIDPSNLQPRAFTSLYDGAAPDSSVVFSGGQYINTREPFVNSESSPGSFAVGQRPHDLPTDNFNQNLHWYHHGPPAYM